MCPSGGRREKLRVRAKELKRTRKRAQDRYKERLQEEAKTAYIDDTSGVFNQDVLGAIELGFMVDVAETIVMSAIERKESRGAQFRTDYPERNDAEWLKHVTITASAEGAPTIGYSPVTMTQWEPQERAY